MSPFGSSTRNLIISIILILIFSGKVEINLAKLVTHPLSSPSHLSDKKEVLQSIDLPTQPFHNNIDHELLNIINTAVVEFMQGNPNGLLLSSDDVEVRGEWALGRVVVNAFVEKDGGTPNIILVLARHTPTGWVAAVETTPTFLSWLPLVDNTLISPIAKANFSVIGSRSTGPTNLSLPWTVGETWGFSGGPHDVSSPCIGCAYTAKSSSLDFSTAKKTGVSTDAVRAAGGGVAYTVSSCPHMVRVDHENGWQTRYHHLREINISNGQQVGRGTQVGLVGGFNCAGESVFSTHLDFSILNGANINAGLDIQNFVIGGWSIAKLDKQYNGKMTRLKDGLVRVANKSITEQRDIFNEGIIGSGETTKGCQNYPHNGIVLFDGYECSGLPREFTSEGFFKLSDVGWNERTKSIYVGSGKSVRVWLHNNFASQSRCVNESFWDLRKDYYDDDDGQGAERLNESITWIQIFNSNNCSSGVTLNGKVSLNGITSPVALRKPTSIIIKPDGSSNEIFGYPVFPNPDGSFSFVGIKPGTYRIRVKGINTLSDATTVTVGAGSNSIGTFKLKLGDLDNDNSVDLTDYSKFVNHFLQAHPLTDFTGDGITDLSDYSRLLNNFFEQGTSIAAISSERVELINLQVLPTTTTLAIGEEFDLVIQAEAGDQSVLGVQTLLNFDPERLQVVSISRGESLPSELENTYDNVAGHINLASGTTNSAYPTGTFTVATVHMVAVNAVSASPIFFSTEYPRITKAEGPEAAIAIETQSVSITITSSDTTPPNGYMAKPMNSSFQNGEVTTLGVDVSDEEDVDFVQYLKWIGGDWENICRVDAPPFDCEWNISNEPDGEVLITAQATDFVGNTSYYFQLEGGEWHTFFIDKTSPISSVSLLPATQSNTQFTVAWSGTDNISGIAFYDIQFQENDGGWRDWLINTMSTSSEFFGQPGRTYQFRSVAYDNAGNIEEWSLVPDAETTILDTATAAPTYTPTPTIASTTITPTLTMEIGFTPTATMEVEYTATATLSSNEPMMSNSGFETGIVPWVMKAGSSDKVKCNKDGKTPVTTMGNCAFVFKGGAGENSKLEQNASLEGLTLSQGQTLRLSAWVKATNAAASGKIKVRVKYSDETETGKIDVSIGQSTEYTELTGSYTLESPNVSKIKVQINHKSSAGKVYLDDIRLSSGSALFMLP